jgi:hypothetical protein
MRSTRVKITIAVASVLAWAAFLYLDAQWNACIGRAVEEGKKTYGELYGPLAFFRPLSMYSAFALSLACVALLVFQAKKKTS